MTKGCLKFFLAVVLFFLLAIALAGMAGFFWTERHFYLEQALPLPAPELDLPHQAKLLKLLPLRDFVKGEAPGSSLKISLTEPEANWLLNYYLSTEKPGARAELQLEENRITGKYSRELNKRKYQNIMFDASLDYQNCEIQVELERLQIGDFLVPATFLGQLGYLLESYLEREFCSAQDRGFAINEIKVKPDSVQLLLLKP